MPGIRRFLRRLLALVRPGRAEADLAREIDAHLHLIEEQFIAGGMPPDEAHYAARRAFGGVAQAKEHQRDARAFRTLAGWPMDLKLGARMLVKSPGLTIVAVLALTVAIGGGVAYMELVNDLYRPSLPLADGDRIVGIQNWDVAKDKAEPHLLHDFLRWREQARSVEHLGAVHAIERNLVAGDGRSEPVRGVEISTSAFRLVPTPPLLGRPLRSEDENPSAPPVVLIGYSLWQSRFSGEPNVVGRQVRLGSGSYTVVGVMPEAFGFPINHSLWLPLRIHGASVTRGGGPELRVFGRLAPGAERETAQAELNAITLRAAADAPASNQHLRPQVKPYLESILTVDADDGTQKVILYSVNIFFLGLLGICGANVATLVFARTATREGEITVRTALGASRGRIIAQLFAEALVLTSVAAVMGLTAAAFGVRLITDLVRAQGIPAPFWWNEQLAPLTLAYTLVLAVLAAAIIGIVPGLKATGPEMQARLKHAGAGGSGMKFGALWTGVIVGQVALTVVFLLTVVSLAWNAHGGRNGDKEFVFPTAEYLTLALEIDRDSTISTSRAAAQADRNTALLAAYLQLEQRLEADPGVAGVTYTNRVPGLGTGEFWVELDGIEPATRPSNGPLWVGTSSVAADFFATLNAPLVLGRTFTQTEIELERPVAVVDETFARLIFGAANPIGQRVRHQQNAEHAEAGPWLEIIGVAKDLTVGGGKTTEDAVLYRPLAPATASPIEVVVRAKGDAATVVHRLRAVVGAADPSLRLQRLRTLDERYEEAGLAYEVLAQGLSVVSLVAILLATAGVYALMSFTLARRTREIGIRVALGAAPRAIVTAIFSRAFKQIAVGVIAGSIPGAALVAFGAPEVARGGGLAVAATATAAVGLVIVVIALFACTLPARRALRIEPVEALRADA